MKTKLMTIAFFALTINVSNAQGFLNKLKEAAKPKEPVKNEKKLFKLLIKQMILKMSLVILGSIFL